MGSGAKIVVIDDDPTGSQTVHGCPLLLRWDRFTLAEGLDHPSPLLFLLANSRALAPAEAEERLREICRALRPALAARPGPWLLVSRGDSTLRGHFPLEVEVIAAELGPFDATLLAPAFLEGGRTTVDGVHRLHGRPVHESEFARDRLFGYRTSHLPEWVAEKSDGRIAAAAVQRLGLAELERGGEPLRQRLAGLRDNVLVAVDAERPVHLAALGAAVRELSDPAAAARWGRPRRFLFQSAASLLNGLAPLPPPAQAGAALAGLRRRGADGGALPGLVLVGSHVPLADAQLAALQAQPGCGTVELPVARLHRLLEGPLPERLLASLEAEWLAALEAHLTAGRTPVLHTSRGELVCRHAAERRALGLALAGLMGRLAARLAPRLGYVISKGGITSQTLLAEGLGLAQVELQGQLLPGLSMVLARRGGVPGAAGLPVLTLPGNLGEADTLVAVWRLLEAL
ncbi:MAG: four-carbon acid sugar kinase family protein [Synechococcaceae cyanobacterium]